MHDNSMIDPLDREIAQALAVDPSPEFVARVRQRVAAEPAPPTWRWTWVVMTSGALAAAAAVMLLIVQGDQPRQTRAPLLGARQTASAAALPDVAPGFIRTASRLAPQHVQRERRHEAPEILVDAREARALQSLIAGAQAGTIDLEPVLRASKPAVMELGPLTAIDIPLITFEPIAQGVQQ